MPRTVARAAARAGLILLFIYVLALGGTFNGIVQPTFRMVGVIGLGVIASVWLLTRVRAVGWRRIIETPLDFAILPWVAAIVFSGLTHIDVWRRSAMGWWFVGLYIAIWYTLSDLIARRNLSRKTLLDSLLIAGVVIVLFGYIQMRGWASADLPRALAGQIDFNPPRPVSTFGNANSLAAFLVMLIPLTAARWVSASRAGKAALSLYSIAAGGLLLLTTSRGGWIGAAAGLIAVGIGFIAANDWRAWWGRQQRFARTAVAVIGAMLVIGVAGGVIVSLGWGGRSLSARTWIYDAAWQTFTAQPLVGSGLYTFGRDLARYYSLPTYEPHAHAHNIVLHVAAELGIVGLVALAVLIAATARALWRTWRMADAENRWIVVGAIGAAVGFFVHHLFDVPSMMPAIALTMIVITAAGIEPSTASVPVTSPRPLSIPGSIAAAWLWLVLFLSGLLSASIYRQYWDAVVIDAPSGRYADAAAALLPVTANDSNPAYVYTAGMLWALSAQTGTPNAANNAAATFLRFTLSEPDYSFGWVNLAVMRDLMGDREGALTAWRMAADRARQSWSIQYRWGEAAEGHGEIEAAREAYAHALRINPDAPLYPAWDDSPIRRDLLLSNAPPMTGVGEAVAYVIAGDAETALRLWNGSQYRAESPSLTIRYGIDALIAAERGDLDEARASRERALASMTLREDSAWIFLLDAQLALAAGDLDSAAASLDAMRAALEVDDLGTDWESGANIFYGQLLTLVIPRIFVPQAQIDTTYTGVHLAALDQWLTKQISLSS